MLQEALGNLAIPQQWDRLRFRYMRGGGYDRPLALLVVGCFVMIWQKKDHTIQLSIRLQKFRIVDLV